MEYNVFLSELNWTTIQPELLFSQIYESSLIY